MLRRVALIANVAAFLICCSAGAPDASETCPAKPQVTCSPAAGDNQGCGIEDGVFMHGPRSGCQIALTFDACPTSHVPSFAPDVVDYLEHERVPVTFFVSGRWAEANPQDLRRLEAVPFFEIAFHGYRHPRLVDAPAGTIQAELENGKTALQRLGVTPVPLFRPPYGDRPPELAPLARQDGVIPVMGDVGLGDPDPNRTADVMERDAIRWVQAGSIIVMHVNGRGYATAETVRDLVPALRARGYEFVRVSDLVRGCGLEAGR
ncbi:MAG: polysaccharide deacetylase family protein [Candidatus Binataceae bacterium]